MTRKLLASFATAFTLCILSSAFLTAHGEKKSAKSIDVTSQDLSIQSLDSAKAQSPEFQSKLTALKSALSKYKAALSGRAAFLTNTEEPTLTDEFQTSIAAKTPAKEIGKKVKPNTTVSGLPAAWEGVWAGPAILDKMTYSKALQKAQPQAVASTTGIMHSDRLGYCNLIFEANAENARLQQYPTVTFRADNPALRPGTSDFIGTAPAKNTMLSDGGLKNSEQMFNQITELKPEIFEQDLGERSLTMRRGKQNNAELRENVVYYSLISTDQMYVYIAQVDYLANGDFKSKLLMHAILKRKHETA